MQSQPLIFSKKFFSKEFQSDSNQDSKGVRWLARNQMPSGQCKTKTKVTSLSLSHTHTQPDDLEATAGSLFNRVSTLSLIQFARHDGSPQGPAQFPHETGNPMSAADSKTCQSKLQRLLFNFLKISQCHRIISDLNRDDRSPAHPASRVSQQNTAFLGVTHGRRLLIILMVLPLQTKFKN